MKHSRLCLIAALLVLPAVAFAQNEPAKPTKAGPAEKSRAALEKAFAEKLSGATLVGLFTVDGKNAGRPPKPERYELGKVSKAGGDFWTFEAKLKYGEKETDTKIPITVKILWAGDTPVITLDELTIPGLGTFDARVLFHEDRYVGTWQHGEHGGHMFGRVERAGKKGEKTGRLDPVEAAPVSGRVTLNGEPLSDATVLFESIGERGKSAKGLTDPAGKFQLNAPLGRNRVRIRAAERPGLEPVEIPARYNVRSALTFEVRAGKNVADFDLAR